MVRRQIRTTNKRSSAILAALRPFGDTAGALRGGCKRSLKDLHFTLTAQALPFTSVKALPVSINQVRCVFLIAETERERHMEANGVRQGERTYREADVF